MVSPALDAGRPGLLLSGWTAREFQLGGLLDAAAVGGGLLLGLDAGHLDDDAVGALALDEQVRGAGRVEALARWS